VSNEFKTRNETQWFHDKIAKTNQKHKQTQTKENGKAADDPQIGEKCGPLHEQIK
jgi:hypothetical protein